MEMFSHLLIDKRQIPQTPLNLFWAILKFEFEIFLLLLHNTHWMENIDLFNNLKKISHILSQAFPYPW